MIVAHCADGTACTCPDADPFLRVSDIDFGDQGVVRVVRMIPAPPDEFTD